MLNVFIDTSVFVAEGYVKGKGIATLFDAAKEEKIQILLPDITEHEIRSHLRMDVEKNPGTGKVKELKKSFMYAVTDLRAHIDELLKVDAEALIADVEKELDRQFVTASVVRLPLPIDLDMNIIMEKYKALEPPFSEKKKSEFPDAIALQTLELWCQKNNDTCIVLASDPDLKSYTSQYLEYREYQEFIASLADYESLVSDEKLQLMLNTNLPAIRSDVRKWAYEQYDDSTIYPHLLQIEDIHDYTIGDIDIEVEDELQFVGKGFGSLSYKTYVNIVVPVEVSHPDYYSGYYDSEDQQWYFINEHIGHTMEGRIRIPIIINYFYGLDVIELDSINNDKSLSWKEKCESVVLTGEHEYPNEEVEVEHDVCPHCGAEMLIHEIIPYHVSGHKEKEDILCPKCHKVICTRNTNGYFKTELLENK